MFRRTKRPNSSSCLAFHIVCAEIHEIYQKGKITRSLNELTNLFDLVTSKATT